MIDIRTKKDIKEYPILEEPKLYIYIMLNDSGKVKIGKTKNIQQRYQSLCGSNGQGNKIIKVCVSPSTYLYTIENIMHEKFDKFRIPNTEWFFDKEDAIGEKLFDEAVNELKLLFSSTGYKTCNKLRESLCKGGAEHDN
jgi:hypothetical protein